MRDVVPSQAVKAIESLFPNIQSATGDATYSATQTGELRAIVDLISRIPTDLLPQGADYAGFIVQKATIKQYIITISRRGHTETLYRDPVWRIWKILKKCDDQFLPPEFADLPFITDAALRKSIGQDIGAAERAFHASNFKATTILSGAAIEALLFWTLCTIPTADIDSAINTLRANKISNMKSGMPLEDMNLSQFIILARDRGLIEPSTAQACNLAREYRNLIHPGAVKRLAATCDRATALAAMSAVAHVIRDLS